MGDRLASGLRDWGEGVKCFERPEAGLSRMRRQGNALPPPQFESLVSLKVGVSTKNELFVDRHPYSTEDNSAYLLEEGRDWAPFSAVTKLCETNDDGASGEKPD